MKSKIAKMLIAGFIGLQLVGCSAQNNETKEETQAITQEVTEETGKNVYFREINAGDYVTLGEYKGLEVTNTQQPISEEDVDIYIQYMLSMYSGELEEVTDRDVVENGDVANIDYEGKKDGVAFDGGTAQGYDLTIGSGSFIDGFEEGLVGVKKGETVDLELTFPENYHAEELAGAKVVFTVTVNGIYKKAELEFNDEFVTSLGIENVSTTDEYRVYLKAMLEENEKQYALQDMETEILTKVTENATVNGRPQEMVDKFNQVTINNMSYNAQMYGMDLESFVSSYYGMDLATFEVQALESAEESTKQALVCLKIAEEENIVVTEEEVDAEMEATYADYGYESAEAFKATVDVEEYKDSLLLNKIVDFLVENATIVEKEATAE